MCDELKNLWNREFCSPHFESTLKLSLDSLNYIEGLDNYVKIIDEGQTGSTSFNLSKSLTSTSTPKDVQVNTNLQSKQTLTMKPDKPLTSNLCGYQNITPEDDVYIFDTEDKEIKLGKWLPPSVNQTVRKKDQVQAQNHYNGNNSGSVPTTIRPFDGTDPAYTVEEYLNSIVAAMVFSSGKEPVNKPGHHQWKVKKRAALILHTLPGPVQKWYSTIPSETKLDWEKFCKVFSDMFNSKKNQNKKQK